MLRSFHNLRLRTAAVGAVDILAGASQCRPCTSAWYRDWEGQEVMVRTESLAVSRPLCRSLVDGLRELEDQ